MSLFERVLSVSADDVEWLLREPRYVPWADFLLNPRRLRGSDFLMRWSQGEWSEARLVEAVQRSGDFYALPYGPSGVAPSDDVRAFELYFERLDQAGLGDVKRPDLLIFGAWDREAVTHLVRELGGQAELPFSPETDERMQGILDRALIAVECENSLWRARQMPDYGAQLKPMRRLDGQLGLRKAAVLPTVILKDEDRNPLRGWQEAAGVPIHIWHVFYDMAFGLAFDEAEALIASGRIAPTEQVFQAPGGATTKKAIFKVYYQYAYPLGDAEEEPSLVADSITDKNGHILPYVRFVGGSLRLSDDALTVLRSTRESRKG